MPALVGVLSETCTLLIFKRQLHHINVIKSIYNCSSVNTIQDKLTCCATNKKLVFTVADCCDREYKMCKEPIAIKNFVIDTINFRVLAVNRVQKCTSQIKASKSPRQPPGLLNFGKCLFKSPLPRRKAVQMPHHRSISPDPMPPFPETLPDYCFHFSVASNMLPEDVYINIV